MAKGSKGERIEMSRPRNDLPGGATVGIAMEDGALIHTVTRILRIMGRYEVAVFDRLDVNRGFWPEFPYAAVVASPGAFQKRRTVSSSSGSNGRAGAPVILAVQRKAFWRHRNKLAAAEGFVLTDETLLRLPSLVPLAAYGLSIMPRISDGESRQEIDPRLSRLKSLSSRDLQVLAELSRGRSNQIIADRLGISLAKAKVHVRRIIERLGSRNRTDAAVFAATFVFPSSPPLPNWQSKTQKGGKEIAFY